MRLSVASAIVLAGAATVACGSDDEEPITTSSGGGAGGSAASASGGDPSGGTNSGGSPGGGSSGGGAPSGGSPSGGTPANGGTPPALNCDTAPCDVGAGMMGIPVTPCCVSDTVCGVNFGQGCTDPSTFLGDGGLGGLIPIEEETIVLDQSCPEQTFQGTTLPGCCDASGTCGASTEGFGGGLVPTSCMTPADIQQVVGSFGGAGVSFDAGAEQSCNYPGGSSGGDAGGSTTGDAGGSTTGDAG